MPLFDHRIVAPGCTDVEVDSLQKAELTRYCAAGKRAEQVRQHADYARVAREVFGMPALPLVDAVTILEGTSFRASSGATPTRR